MAVIGFMTYNSIDGVFSGVHHHRGNTAIVLSNTRGHTWAVKELTGEERPNDYRRSDTQYSTCVRSEIDVLFEQLSDKLSELDHLVVYVGSAGSERAIELARRVPATKLTFVGCDCGLDHKTQLLRENGLWDARRILCECGGRRTMKSLYQHFMERGDLEGLEFEQLPDE